MNIRAYILAGGKSSRMGRDKAMLELGGTTLLTRAVKMLRSVPTLQTVDRGVVVTVAGKRDALEGADRSIVDRYPGCGPLGGIEAALDDLDRVGDADWAFFIPVDMPLLNADLIEALLTTWITAIESDDSILACLAEVDGRPQPLVSMVHRTGLGEVRMALDAGLYKVVPVLKSAGAYCTSLSQVNANCGKRDDRQGTSLSAVTSEKRPTSVDDSYRAKGGDDGRSEASAWFINVNTEADLIEVATLMKRWG